MLWSLVATFVGGFAGGGVGLILYKLSRGRLPKGIIPVAAGIAMMITTVAQEYAWYPNNLANMSPQTVVLVEREQQAWWQPWTYVTPRVSGFVAYIPEEVRETAEGTGIFVVQTQLRERWQPAIIKPILVDCGASARAELFASTEIDDQGAVENAAWLAVEPDDPILAAICRGESVTG